MTLRPDIEVSCRFVTKITLRDLYCSTQGERILGAVGTGSSGVKLTGTTRYPKRTASAQSDSRYMGATCCIIPHPPFSAAAATALRSRRTAAVRAAQRELPPWSLSSHPILPQSPRVAVLQSHDASAAAAVIFPEGYHWWAPRNAIRMPKPWKMQEIRPHRRCRAFFSRHVWSINNCNS